MTFQGLIYENQKQFIAFGAFTHIPKGTPDSAAIDFDLLVVTFNIKDPDTNQNRFPLQQAAYIFIKGDATSIGDVQNQRPQPYTGEPWQTVKHIVLEAFHKLG